MAIVRVQYSTERIEFEWPADCSFASSWETSLYNVLYSIDRREMIRLLSSVFHFRVESLSVTLSLRSKRKISSLVFAKLKFVFIYTQWKVEKTMTIIIRFNLKIS